MTEQGWTLDTLRAYTDAAIEHAANVAAISLAAAERLSSQRFDDQSVAVAAALAAQKEAVAAALTAADRAVSKAELAANARFEGVNEFRGQLADQATTFMSRAEGLLQIKANADKIDALATRIDRSEGQGAGAREAHVEQGQSRIAGNSQLMAVIAGLAVLVAVASVIVLAFKK